MYNQYAIPFPYEIYSTHNDGEEVFYTIYKNEAEKQLETSNNQCKQEDTK